MKKYIFGKRDSIHIIDLTQTLELTKVALEKVHSTIANNGKILFVSGQISINENGELELWSFAQSAVSGNNIQAKRAAIGRAETKARGQISEFINTSLDLKEKTQDYFR